MDDSLTQKERDIVERLKKRFPGAPPTAEIQHVLKPGGIVEALHLSWSRDIAVDVDRAVIAWPSESPLRIAEAIEAQLEVHGLVVAPFSVTPSPGIFSRIAASSLMAFARLSPAIRERALAGRRTPP